LSMPTIIMSAKGSRYLNWTTFSLMLPTSCERSNSPSTEPMILSLSTRVCHGYTAGTNFLNRTRTRQHRTRYGYGYIPHRNFCGVKRVLIKFGGRSFNNIENIFKNTKKKSNGGEGVGVAAAAAPATPAAPATATPALTVATATGTAVAAAPAPAVSLIVLVRAYPHYSALAWPSFVLAHLCSHSLALVHARPSCPPLFALALAYPRSCSLLPARPACSHSCWPPRLFLVSHPLLLPLGL
jgi:hypothetical protein